MIKLLPATRSDDEGHRLAVSRQSRHPVKVGAQWVARSAHPEAEYSVGVVVVDVFAKKLSKVALVHHDHVIQQLSTSAADPSLGNPILPRTPKGRSLRLDSNTLDRLSDSF